MLYNGDWGIGRRGAFSIRLLQFLCPARSVTKFSGKSGPNTQRSTEEGTRIRTWNPDKLVSFSVLFL